MTNHLAAELRGILDDLHDAEHGDVPKPLVRERLERLAEHVEAVGADPVEVDASTELTATFGLEPDQEIRDRALHAALKACDGRGLGWDAANVTALTGLADELAAWIRTGERPE